MALKELKAEGLSFNLTYSRGPFFLNGTQEDINADRDSKGIPRDAPYHVVYFRDGKPPAWEANMDRLMSDAGLSPRNTAVTYHRVQRDSMDAHRLAQYAATEENEKGEKMWFALSRRWFMGKDTNIKTVKLDGEDLLKECAEYAGLNMVNVEKVLRGELVTREEIMEQVHRVHAVGIHSIPNMVFELQGRADGSWKENPALRDNKYRATHQGSGSKASFKQLLLKLHRGSAPVARAC